MSTLRGWQEAGEHLYLGKPLPVSPRRGARGWPSSGRHSALSAHLFHRRGTFCSLFILAHLIEENAISQVGVSSQRGAQSCLF